MTGFFYWLLFQKPILSSALFLLIAAHLKLILIYFLVLILSRFWLIKRSWTFSSFFFNIIINRWLKHHHPHRHQHLKIAKIALQVLAFFLITGLATLSTKSLMFWTMPFASKVNTPQPVLKPWILGGLWLLKSSMIPRQLQWYAKSFPMENVNQKSKLPRYICILL